MLNNIQNIIFERRVNYCLDEYRLIRQASFFTLAVLKFWHPDFRHPHEKDMHSLHVWFMSEPGSC